MPLCATSGGATAKRLCSLLPAFKEGVFSGARLPSLVATQPCEANVTIRRQPPHGLLAHESVGPPSSRRRSSRLLHSTGAWRCARRQNAQGGSTEDLLSVGLAPTRQRPCWAHQRERRPLSRTPFVRCTSFGSRAVASGGSAQRHCVQLFWSHCTRARARPPPRVTFVRRACTSAGFVVSTPRSMTARHTPLPLPASHCAPEAVPQ